MLRKIRQIVMSLVLLATLGVSIYLFLTGNNWGGFGTGLLLVLEMLLVAVADAVARHFGEQAIEDTKLEHYNRGYEAGLKEGEKRSGYPRGYSLGYEVGLKEGETSSERRQRRG